MLPNTFINLEISSGTLRTEDLVNAVGSYYTSFNKHLSKDELAPIGALCLEFENTKDEEERSFIWEELFDILNSIAPEGCIFGSHEGDGAAIGFWQHEEIEV